MPTTASEQRALSKAMALDLAAQVTRIRCGLYRVASTSEAGVTWTVAVENGTYACTCRASNKAACVHRAAVYLAKVQATGARVVGVKPATRQRKPAAARWNGSSPAAIRPPSAGGLPAPTGATSWASRPRAGGWITMRPSSFRCGTARLLAPGSTSTPARSCGSSAGIDT